MLPRVLIALRRMLSATLVRLAALVLGLGPCFRPRTCAPVIGRTGISEERWAVNVQGVAAVLTVDLSAAARSALGAVGALVLAGAGVQAVLVDLEAALAVILLLGGFLLGEFLDVWEWFDRL